MAVIYLLLEIFDRKVFGTGDLMKAFTNGLKIGFICVVLQMLGDTLIGKTHDKSISDYAGKGMKYAGDLMYDICDFIAKNFPAIIALLNIVMRLMYVQKCIEDIDRSLDRQYYSSSYGSFQSGLAGTQSSMAKLQGCLSQFNQIMNSAYMVGQSMYYSGAAIWGTTSFKLYKSSGTEITRGKATICKGESLKYKVKNWCKVIREKGTDAQYIRITSSTKNNCAPVTIYSAETCRGYYGYGYGMGYTGTGMWPGGWAGGYTPMHQYAGTTEGQFIPTEVCGDDKNKENTYHLSIPGTGQYYEITYNPKC